MVHYQRGLWLFLSVLLINALSPDKTLAQEFLSDSGSPGKQKIKLSFKHSSDFFSEAESTSKEHRTARQIEGALSIPVFQNDNSSYGVAGKAKHLNFDTLTTPSDFLPVTDLYSYQYGLFWAYEKEDKSTWSVNANYGSASDNPFQSEDVSTFDATLVRKMSSQDMSSWIFILNYSNNRSFLNNIPLPGFAYVFVHSSKSRGGVIGIPFFSY